MNTSPETSLSNQPGHAATSKAGMGFGRSAKARYKGIEYQAFFRYAFLLLLPLLTVMYITSSWMLQDYEEEVHRRVYTAMEHVLENFDAEITHLANTTMQTAANPVFKNAHTKELPCEFEPIRDTLENIMSSNRLFTQGSVSFFSATTPTLFYTEMGTFNERYFRFYDLDNGATISIRTVLENTDYMRVIPYHNLHAMYAAQPSLDVIYALTGQPGSFMIYSIPEPKLKELLVQNTFHPEEVYLLNASGNKLFPLDLERTEALTVLRDMIDEEMARELVDLRDGREIIMVQSPLSGLCLAYVISQAEIFGSVREMSLMLYGALAFIVVLGAILSTVLSFWNVRPIREILYLTERLSPDSPTQEDQAALDRIRTILIRLYAASEAQGHQAADASQPDEAMEEPEDATLLMDMQEHTDEPLAQQELQRRESTLLRQVIAFIDQHQEDGNLCVSMVADHFDVEISNLSHQFKNGTGYALSDYINARKLDVACTKLRDTRMSVTSIAEGLGYSHASSFIRMFKKVYGITPTQFRSEAQAAAREQE